MAPSLSTVLGILFALAVVAAIVYIAVTTSQHEDRENFIHTVHAPAPEVQELRALKKSVEPPTKGIVMVAGGLLYGSMALENVQRLRSLGCDLPLEIFYMGKEELDCEPMSTLDSMPGVSLFNVQQWLPDVEPGVREDGYRSKSSAIVYSSFDEIIFLDADNLALSDPSVLFELPEYQKTGALFWRDKYDFGEITYAHIAGISFPHTFPAHSSKTKKTMADLGLEQMYQQESGQLVINKRSCIEALEKCLHLNSNSKHIYAYVHGDKDTFQLAWNETNTPYHFCPYKPSFGGIVDDNGEFTFAGFVQGHPSTNKPMFYHRAGLVKEVGLQDVTHRQVPSEHSVIHSYGKERHRYTDSVLESFSPMVFASNAIKSAS